MKASVKNHTVRNSRKAHPAKAGWPLERVPLEALRLSLMDSTTYVPLFVRHKYISK